MNNKGFTLIELLASIVILGLVLTLTGISATKIIKEYKEKSEVLFVEKLSKKINDYITLKGQTLVAVNNPIEFTKNTSQSHFYQVKLLKDNSLYNIKLSNLVEEGLMEEIVNPKNKKNCLDNVDPEITIYRDTEFVYYYYIDLSSTNTSCDIKNNNIIDTRTTKLKEALENNKQEIE